MPIIATFLNGYDDTGTPDDVIGTVGGYDIVQFQLDSSANSTDLRTFDMRITNFYSIEEIELDSYYIPMTIILSAAQIGSGLSANLLIDGSGAPGYGDVIKIYMDTETSLDLSGWTFQGWTDTIYVFGDSSAETITAPSGDFNISTSDGNDTFRYVDGRDGSTGQVINGGNADDTLLLVLNATATDNIFDLRGPSFYSIEKITFSSSGTQDATLRLYGNQFQNGNLSATLQVTGVNGASNTETIEIYMDTQTIVDLSGWSFMNWGGQNEKVIIHGDSSLELITGSSQDDEILGGGGADTLYGMGGDDIIDGGG
ncbi:MAG TPA: hypothetical protein ENK15_08270, partial [Thermopetrobacter sp.]|nr:hypothetical protein [Thermopetrobacter sp.]